MASRKPDLKTLLLLLAMYGVLAANVALYVVARQHALVHVVIGAAGVHLAFTIWHEAVHGTVSKKKWVNDVTGVVGMLPYMTPYFMQRWVHLEHHRKLNQREDPNYIYTDGSLLTLPLRYVRALGYAKKLLSTDPRTRAQRISDLATTAFVGGVYLACAWFGALEAVLVLWFFPVVVAKLVMDWYINYLPHVGLPPDRFAGTRILDVPWFTPLVLGHNYHAIHHLWPTVPWHGYRAVFVKKLEYLKKNGVPIEHRVFGSWGEPVRIDGQDARAG